MPRSIPPAWLPWLAPLIAVGVGAAVGRYGLNGGFWTVLLAALAGGVGFLALYGGYRRWRRRKG